jgi:hypothetical protein
MPLARGFLLIAFFSSAWGVLTGINVALLRGMVGASWGMFSLALPLVLAFIEALVLLELVDRAFIRPPKSRRTQQPSILEARFPDVQQPSVLEARFPDVQQPSVLEARFPDVHARLMAMLDERTGDKGRVRQQLQAFLYFAVVIAEGAERRYAPAFSAFNELERELSVSLVQERDRLGSSVLERLELTEVGIALSEWITRHPDLVG